MTENTSNRKLQGYELFESMGKPTKIVAPMVDQSELAWRILSRKYGATLAYTPMIHAKQFLTMKNDNSKRVFFDKINNEEGVENVDRPLVIQFAANDPDILLEAAKDLEGKCDAIDINFGCPQQIARKGRYGSWLQDEWEVIHNLINKLHTGLVKTPVTAKFRVFDDVQHTIEYAQMMERAGAQILTVHGRTREMKGHNTGLADWDKIKAVKKAVNVPVFANGNILYQEDIQKCMDYTGCDGIMSAEGNLYNPALFLDKSSHPSVIKLANEYLDIVENLKTTTPNSSMKAHLFKILRPCLAKWPDLRERLGRGYGVNDWREVVKEFKTRLDQQSDFIDNEELTDVKELNENGIRDVPYYYAQPYFREQNESKATIDDKQDNEVKTQVENYIQQRPLIAGEQNKPCVGDNCPALAFKKCIRNACLTCCRSIGQKNDEHGCIEHESKEKKRKLIKDEKRLNWIERKKSKKVKNNEN